MGEISCTNVFVAKQLSLQSPTTAAEWMDAHGVVTGAQQAANGVSLLLEIFAAGAADGSAASPAPERIAWALLPLFAPATPKLPAERSWRRPYLCTGRFQLPLYEAEGAAKSSSVLPITPPILAAVLERDVFDEAGLEVLQNASKGKLKGASRGLKSAVPAPKLLNGGASVFVRLVDLQLRPDLRPTVNSPLDIGQVPPRYRSK